MLPAVRTDEEWQAVVFDETIVRPAAEDLAARLGLRAPGSAVTQAAPVPFTRSATAAFSSSIPRCPLRKAAGLAPIFAAGSYPLA